MFRSARNKLTFFYLAIIVLLSVTLSLTTRWVAEREYIHSDEVQRGAINGIILQRLDQPYSPYMDFKSVQDAQQALVRQRLNEYVFLINFSAFVIGGLLSYWFAGWTLAPIEEAHDAQKRFASDASHELRTPLTVLRTENEVFLRQKDFTKDDARGLISSNLEEVQRLEQLASNLLALTQFEGVELALEPSDVEKIVSDATAAIAKTKSVSDRFTIKLAPAQVMVNHESAVQLVSIVLDNALKYTPKKTTINISGSVIDGNYILIIDDHGPGIPETDLDIIFDRLYRGDKARSSQVPGYGLGLSLAKEIAKINKGSIKASNNESGGARFMISLPVTQAIDNLKTRPKKRQSTT